jgi:hypothetical protein
VSPLAGSRRPWGRTQRSRRLGRRLGAVPSHSGRAAGRHCGPRGALPPLRLWSSAPPVVAVALPRSLEGLPCLREREAALPYELWLPSYGCPALRCRDDGV